MEGLEEIFTFSLVEKMAVSFENNYVILSQERAEHINERHVDLDKEAERPTFYPSSTSLPRWHC